MSANQGHRRPGLAALAVAFLASCFASSGSDNNPADGDAGGQDAEMCPEGNPATCQSLDAECGTPSDGCGGTLSCGECGDDKTCSSSGICVDLPTPDPNGRGPTGQWPDGFPAYDTEAEIVTDGLPGGLLSALDDAACSDGCVIEHPGTVSGAYGSRAGTGPIVVRPPIGLRADYVIGDVEIAVDGLVFAGYQSSGGQLLVQGNGANGLGSGFAWIDNDDTGGRMDVFCNYGLQSKGLFYEMVFRRYAATEDRSGIRGTAGGTCVLEVVGAIIAGDPAPPPAHADTFQSYNPGGVSTTTVKDSVVWSSWDKIFQSAGEPDETTIFDNCFLPDPSHSQELWPGPPIGGPLDGYYLWAGKGTITNSTVLGSVNDSETEIGNSELYDTASHHTDLGGNTTLNSPPPVPQPPTPTQLDEIWSP